MAQRAAVFTTAMPAAGGADMQAPLMLRAILLRKSPFLPAFAAASARVLVFALPRRRSKARAEEFCCCR